MGSSDRKHKSVCLLLKVEQHDGALLAKFLFNIDSVSEICGMETGIRPNFFHYLSDRDMILEFPDETVVTGVAKDLQKDR